MAAATDQAGQVDEAAAAVATYQGSTQALREQLVAFITALWQSLGVWRAPQSHEFSGQVVPVVQGAMGHMQSLTVAYLTAMAAAAGHHGSSAPPDRTPTIARVRGGVDPGQVYERPFHLVWRQLAALPHEPGSIEQAVASGLDRAVQTGLTDLQLAKTHTTQQVLSKDRRATGYRRVLEGPHSCGLCIVASTQAYHKAQLMPIHPGCDCSVEPLYGALKPGALDPRALSGAHQAIAERFGRSDAGARAIPGAGGVGYRDVLITHEHGEIGPVLAVRGASFTGPKDLGSRPGRAPARQPATPAADYAAQATLLRRALPAIEAQVAAGDSRLAPVLALRRKRLAELDALAKRAT